MKKGYKMENLDCAICASQMEEAIKKLDGVENAAVSFMMQRRTPDAERMPELVRQVSACCSRIDRNCRVVC